MTRWTPGDIDQVLAPGTQHAARSTLYLLLLGLGTVALGAATAFQPLLVLVGVAATLVVAWVTARPVRGAYLLVLVVPLVVGMSRGLLVPVLRPNELLLLLLLGLAVVWGTFET